MVNNDLGNFAGPKVSYEIVNSDLGHHYGLLYSNLTSLRKFYSEYLKYEIEYNQGNVIFLSYYETPEDVKNNLTNVNTDIDITKYENNGSLQILDSLKVLFGNYPWNFKTEKIRMILNETHNKSRSQDLTLIVDTAPFYHCCKPRELISFEKTFETNFFRFNWKGICLYNKSDMSRVLPVEQKQLLKKYHRSEFTVDAAA